MPTTWTCDTPLLEEVEIHCILVDLALWRISARSPSPAPRFYLAARIQHPHPGMLQWTAATPTSMRRTRGQRIVVWSSGLILLPTLNSLITSSAPSELFRVVSRIDTEGVLPSEAVEPAESACAVDG